MTTHTLPRWTWALPSLALLALLAAGLGANHPALQVLFALALGGTVFAAVHHAELVAHRVGEPFGTLILALAVTVIEAALIVSVMLSGGPEKAALARDTVFAAIMIVCNGIVGLCLLLGGIRHHEQDFQLRGASSAMTVLAALAVLTLILPNYTRATPGPMLGTGQLAFAGLISLVLYATFVFVQTIRHRDYFLTASDTDEPAAPPPSRLAWISGGWLMACLVAVVGLAKLLSPAVEKAVANAGAPESVVGIVIATLVLLPEGLAATRAARANRLQTSLNLALGSVLATIGLTIPVVAALFVFNNQPLILGLEAKETVLLALTLLVGTMTLSTGRTTVLQGIVHLVIFAAFLFLAVVP